MSDLYHLHRAWYKTDVTEDEPEYVGAFSASLPARAVEQRQIVAVHWTDGGEVEVTYLIPGPSPLAPAPASGQESTDE